MAVAAAVIGLAAPAAGTTASAPRTSPGTGVTAAPVGTSSRLIAGRELLAAPGDSGVGIGCGSTRHCTPSHGGALMSTARNSCTAGVPVRERRTGRWFVMTAGHCVANARGATWRQSGIVLGRGTRWEYGALGTEGRAGRSDVGLVRITANSGTWRARSRVLVMTGRGARSQPIRHVRTARAGEKVCVTGGRGGVTRCGRVVLASTSLRYASPGVPARTVSNLALVSGVCVRPGDSGSPVYAGSTLLGIVVARSHSGCFMWYSRIAGPMRHYGLTVVPG